MKHIRLSKRLLAVLLAVIITAGLSSVAFDAIAETAAGLDETEKAGTPSMALWFLDNYTVNFDANGGAGTPPETQSFNYGEGKTLNANTFTRTGYTFSGWNRKADGTGAAYADAESVNNLIPSQPTRYIRIYMGGNNENYANHITEIEVYGQSSVNLAAGKTSGGTGTEDMGRLTDGIKDCTAGYYEFSAATPQYVTIDLGAVYDVTEVRLWRYWNGGRYYKDTVIVLSETDNLTPNFDNYVLYNADYTNRFGYGAGRDIAYLETQEGMSFRVTYYSDRPLHSARYVRVYMNGNSVDAYNHISELAVYARNRQNIAAGKPILESAASGQDAAVVTDGMVYASGDSSRIFSYGSTNLGTEDYITLDLGASVDITEVRLWRTLNRAYHNTVIVLSDNNIFNDSDDCVIFNGDKANTFGFGFGDDEEYQESVNGKSFYVTEPDADTSLSYPAQYIRVYSLGNTYDVGYNGHKINRITDIEVYDDNSVDVASGKCGSITDGDETSSVGYGDYPGTPDGNNYYTIDLGAVYNVANVNLKRYWNNYADYHNTISYHNTVIVLSQNRTFQDGDICVIWNSDDTNSFGFGSGTDEEYQESALGNTFYIPAAETPLPARSTTLYARWTPNSYTVTYKDGVGAGEDFVENCTYDTEFPVIAGSHISSRTGYTFVDWLSDGTHYTEDQTVKNLTATPNGNVDMIAHWRPNTYTLTYKPGVAEGVNIADGTKTYDTAFFTKPSHTYSNPGYAFAGWLCSNGTTYSAGQGVSNLTADDGAAMTMTAQWAEVTVDGLVIGSLSVGQPLSMSRISYGSIQYIVNDTPVNVAGTLSWEDDSAIFDGSAASAIFTPADSLYNPVELILTPPTSQTASGRVLEEFTGTQGGTVEDGFTAIFNSGVLDDSDKLTFTPALPSGTRLIISADNLYYYYIADSEVSTLPLSSFSQMGTADIAFSGSTGATLRVCVDFSHLTGGYLTPGDVTVRLTTSSSAPVAAAKLSLDSDPAEVVTPAGEASPGTASSADNAVSSAVDVTVSGTGSKVLVFSLLDGEGNPQSLPNFSKVRLTKPDGSIVSPDVIRGNVAIFDLGAGDFDGAVFSVSYTGLAAGDYKIATYICVTDFVGYPMNVVVDNVTTGVLTVTAPPSYILRVMPSVGYGRTVEHDGTVAFSVNYSTPAEQTLVVKCAAKVDGNYEEASAQSYTYGDDIVGPAALAGAGTAEVRLVAPTSPGVYRYTFILDSAETHYNIIVK